MSNEARTIGLSLIDAVLTVCIGVGGVFQGWLAGKSLSLMFALIGVVILGGVAALCVDARHTRTATNFASSAVSSNHAHSCTMAARTRCSAR